MNHLESQVKNATKKDHIPIIIVSTDYEHVYVHIKSPNIAAFNQLQDRLQESSLEQLNPDQLISSICFVCLIK